MPRRARCFESASHTAEGVATWSYLLFQPFV
jgi:hypothetical protein